MVHKKVHNNPPKSSRVRYPVTEREK